jgi:hypothetical protein
VNFANEALYSVTGESLPLGKGISLAYNTEVKINEKFTDFLAYVDVNSVAGDGILLKVGEDEIRLNADGSVYSTLKAVGGDGNFDFDALKNGGVIMIEGLGAKLSISVVGAGQPTDLLENSIAVFEVGNRAQGVEISVATVDETVLSLESVRMYTLKPTIAIAADDWEASDTELPEKRPPNGVVTESTTEKGCGSTIACGMILPVMGLAFAVVRKKKEAQDE